MSAQLVVNSEIGEAVINLIREARQRITLVSPFNDSRVVDLVDELNKARRKGVKIVMYYQKSERKNQDPAQFYPGVESRPVDQLHAKIYANESTVLITSYNLTGKSLYSKEAGLLIQDDRLVREVDSYIQTMTSGSTSAQGKKKDEGRQRAVPLSNPRLRRKLPKKSDIPIGATLTFVRGKRTCTVAEQGPLKVWYGNNKLPRSLTYVTKQITKYNNVAGPRYWRYRGALDQRPA